MAGISKYETFAQQTLGDVYFKPNLELINQSLAARQGKYDTNLATMKGLKAKIGDVPTIEGYDRDRYHQKVQEYDADIDRLKGLYNGDLSRADNELDDFTRKLSDDFGRHGEFNAMQQNYNAYVANAKSLAERRNKNEISEAQYAELSRRLKAYQLVGIGKDAKNWNSWNTLNLTDRIDKDKFLKEFVEIKEKEKQTQGWYRDKNEAGKLIWRKNEHEYISYDDLLAEGKQALQNKLKETGEIEYEYKYYLDQTGEPSVAAYQTRYQVVADKTNEKLRKISTLSGAELQTELKTLYPDLKVTGLDDATTKQYKDHAIKALTERANQYQKKLDESKQWNEMTVKGLHRQEWEEDWLTNITHPYAGAKSHDRFDADIKIESDPYLQQSFEMQKIERQGQIQQSLIDYEFRLNQPKVITTGLNTGVFEVAVETGSDIEDWKTKTNLIKEGEGLTVLDFAGTLFQDMMGKQYGDGLEIAKSEGKGVGGFNKAEDLVLEITKQMNDGKMPYENVLGYKKLDAKALATAQVDGDGNLNIAGKTIKLPLKLENPQIIKNFANKALNNLNLQLAQETRLNSVKAAVAQENRFTPEQIKDFENPYRKIDNDASLTFNEKAELKRWFDSGDSYGFAVTKNGTDEKKIREYFNKYYEPVHAIKSKKVGYDKLIEEKFKATGTNIFQGFQSDAPILESVRPENQLHLKNALDEVAKSGIFNEVPGLVQMGQGAVDKNPTTVSNAAKAYAEKNSLLLEKVVQTGFLVPDVNVGGHDNTLSMTYMATFKDKNGRYQSIPYTVYREASKTAMAYEGSQNIFTNESYIAQKDMAYLINRTTGEMQSQKAFVLPNGQIRKIVAIKPQLKNDTGGVKESGIAKSDRNQEHVFQLTDDKGVVLGSLTKQDAYGIFYNNAKLLNIKNALSNPNESILVKTIDKGLEKTIRVPKYEIVGSIISKNELNSNSSIGDIQNAFGKAGYAYLLNDNGLMNNYFVAHKKGVMSYKESQAYGLQPQAPQVNNQPNVTTIKRTNTNGR